MTRFRSSDLAFVIITCSLILISVAIYNGYPLVFPDTGVYLSQAIEFRGDSSRPPYYSLFLFPIHAKTSLWPVVFVQSAIVTGVLHLAIRTTFKQDLAPRYLLAVTFLLTIFSSLPWHTGQLLPDVFTSIIILAVYIISFGWNYLNILSKVFISILLLVSTTFHYSHLPLLAATGGIALLLAARHQKTIGGLWIPAGLILVSGITAVTAFAAYNFAYSGRASVSLDSSKFLLARLIDDGTAVEYLRLTCPNSDFVLCDHLDEIEGDHNAFLWNSHSPWRHIENIRGFLGARDEAAAIVKGTLSNFPLDQMGKSFKNFAIQFVSFGTGDTLCPCIGDSYTNQVISKHFSNEHNSFIFAKQNANTLPINFFSALHLYAVLASALGCMGYLFWNFTRQHTSFSIESRISSLIIITSTSLVVNSAITGALSGPADRYQSRVIWLVVFAFLIIALHSFLRPPHRSVKSSN